MDGDRGQELPVHPFPSLSYFGDILVPCVLSFFKDIHLVLITVNFSFHHMLVLKNVYPPINYKPNLAVTYQINFCWSTSICLVSWVASSLLRRGMMGSNICYLTLQKKSTLNLWKKFKSGIQIYVVKIELKINISPEGFAYSDPNVRLWVGIF